MRRLAVITTVSFALVPVVMLTAWSFAKGWYWPAILPRQWSTRAWDYLFSANSGIGSATLTSLGIAVAVTVLALLAAIPAGRTIAFREFPGKKQLLFFLLLPILAPPLASAMGVHVLFLRYGLADTNLGVILIHLVVAVPYATLMMIGSFSRFDPAFEDQARTLGASPPQVWMHVTFPAIAPGLAVAAAFAFLISWSQYLLTLLIGGGRVITLPVVLVNFQLAGDEAITAALSLLFLAPTLILFSAVAQFLEERP